LCYISRVTKYNGKHKNFDKVLQTEDKAFQVDILCLDRKFKDYYESLISDDGLVPIISLFLGTG
jgi:hypothetical protein